MTAKELKEINVKKAKINSDTVKILGKIILTKTDTYFNFKNSDCGDYLTKFLMEEL